MNISSIGLYSNLYQVKNVKSQKDKKINFKNYSESFRKAMFTQINNKKDIEQIFKSFIESNDKSFIVSDWFSMIFKTCKDKTDFIFELLNNLRTNQKGVVLADSKGAVAYAHNDSVMFIGPNRDENIEFILNKDKSLSFSRGDAYSTQIIKFYPNSDAKKSDTKINGSDLGQVSETTYYNADGTKRPLRNFINAIFGL